MEGAKPGLSHKDVSSDGSETGVWPACGHPRTFANTVVIGGRFEYCRRCENAKRRERYRQRHPDARKVFLSTTLAERIWHHIQVEPLHWVWTGRQHNDGSAVIEHEGKLIFVAPHLWEQHEGPIKPGHRLYRLCDVSGCVSPTCRAELPPEAALRRAPRPSPDIGERTRSVFEAAVRAATRREGTHLFAVGGKTTVVVRKRELNLRDLLWRHAGNRRHLYKSLVATCECSDCIEPDHQRECESESSTPL